MKILGIDIDTLTRKETLARVRTFLDKPGFRRIATVNPEFLVLAEKDNAFRETLLTADLRIADGFGITLAGLFQGRYIPRFPGADLMEEILSIANEQKLSLFLAVRRDGLCTYEEIRAAVIKKYPHIIIDGENIAESVFESCKLHATNCKLIFCNFGAPEQELFLESLRNNPGTIRLAMGVGGSFDYLTGKQKRAPRSLRAIGLEWLWRLILQPKRFKRIWNAVVIFPTKVIFSNKKAAW